MKIDDTLSEVFNTAPQQKELEVIDNTTGEIVKTPEGKIENDYETARDNLRELLITDISAFYINSLIKTFYQTTPCF